MNLKTLHSKYGTQEKCLAYLIKLRWGKKVVCVHCGSKHVTKPKKGIRFHCNSCNKNFSVLMGTIFEETRLELNKWFEIILLTMNAKMGISAAEVSRDVGVKYHTAWFACHKVRCAMVSEEGIKLEGVVEFDESYLGGKPRHKYKQAANVANLSQVTNKRGRGTNKTPVVGAVEKKGQVYVKIIEKLTGRNLLAMLKKIVKTDDTIVITDDFRSYKQFDKTVEHITIKHNEGYGHGIKTVNTIEGFWSIIKNGIKGNYRAISKKYLPFYLAEFSYKFNKRHLEKGAFEGLLLNAIKAESCLINYKPKHDAKEIFYK
jgi:transposase-like protein